MKTLKFSLFALFFSFAFFACHKGGPFGIKGKGNNVTELKNLDGFDKIQLSIDADIFYIQDSVFKVEISAQQNILTVLKVEVENHTLKFDFKRNVWEHNKITVTVHSPNMNEFNISGSGNITAQTPITATNMELDISGSGSVYLPSLTAKNLKATISGNGDVKIAGGSLVTQDFEISGSGKIDALDIVTQISTANVSGWGDITIHVVESLKATISGSGDISYKGNPTIDEDISGTGKLIHLD